MSAAKLFLCCSVFVVALVSSVELVQFTVEVTDAIALRRIPKSPAERVNFDGSYRFDHSLLPEDFKDLDRLDLRTAAGVDGGESFTSNRGLHGNRTYGFAWIGMAGDRIKFRTNTVDGVWYEFTGQQSSRGGCGRLAGRSDISGEMIKVVDGKWAASAMVELFERCGWL